VPCVEAFAPAAAPSLILVDVLITPHPDTSDEEMEAEDAGAPIVLDFLCPNEYLVVGNQPQNTVVALKKTHRIAHRFDDAWYIGVYKGKDRTGRFKGYHSVYYRDDERRWKHTLAVDEYGPLQRHG
jgi:hypothetical protein